MRNIDNIANDRGSVMLEFVLVMPILLLLFGSTMLTYDLSMANAKLLVANRNLAWLTGDRYAGDSINEPLRKAAAAEFDMRNTLEKAISSNSGPDIWDMGNDDDEWGHKIGKFDAAELAELDADCEWGNLFSGNMQLKMTRLSGIYIGAIGVSSVLFPMDEKEHYYNAAYDLTRAVGDSYDLEETNIESILYHRIDDDSRMTEHYVLNLPKIVLQSWPYGKISIGGIASAIWDSGDMGAGSLFDMNLALPTIGHRRALFLLAGDNDIGDTLETIFGGLSNLADDIKGLSKELDDLF